MTKVCKIKAYGNGKNNERMSTQGLLQLIYKKIEEGFVDFEIDACGQHDIAGALYAKDKTKTLNFTIKNPGQRVGGMALKNTNIKILGSAPADVGWLNSGANITVLGDTGDTAGHCAASGKIYIQGSTGARTGALMKFDPKFKAPELWVLKNTGSFSFEFMSGGIGVICGVDCEKMKSILKNRACVGMVGGTIYIRGKIEDLASCVEITELNKEDKEFLKEGLKDYLKNIERKELYKKLTDFSKWQKIVPKKNVENVEKISIEEFKKKYWFKGGLFGDLVEDNNEVYSLAEPKSKLRKPIWDKKLCVGCGLCLNNCPNKAITKENNEYKADDLKCIGCSICEAICPKKAWSMQAL